MVFFVAEVIAAIATGKTPCAIGILRLSGDGCADVAGRCFVCQSGKPLSEASNRKLVLGTLRDRNGRTIDQALAVYTRAPHSYTGEDTVELQCHGSPAVLSAGLEALCQAGARPALPGEFTKRAFLNGQIDLTGAEAVVDLIDAETADAAANAAAQVGGALFRRLDPIYQSLTDLCSHYHAVLDYPDEDIPDFQLADFSQTIRSHILVLKQLDESCERGRILKNGVKVALLGRPNVGKSSLLNALAGFERVIVTAIPGTTRDTVEERISLDGLPVRLIDTAGIRDASDIVEAMGVDRSVEAARQADLALLLVDAAQALTEEDLRAIETAKQARHSLCVLNKSDLPAVLHPEQLPFEKVFSVSAATGEGLDLLTQEIRSLFSEDLPCDGGILTNTRQQEAVRRAKAALEQALDAMQLGITPDAVLTEIEAAMQAIGELTGKTVREDITRRIFERFCVGK